MRFSGKLYLLLAFGLVILVPRIQAQRTQPIGTDSNMASVLTDSTLAEVSETLSMIPGAGPGWETLHEADKSFKAGDYKSALHRLMQAQARFDKDRDEVGMCVTLLKTGNLYQHWKVYDRALKYFQDVEVMANSMHMPAGFLQNVWMRQAICAQQINQLPVASVAYNHLLESYQTQNYTSGIRLILTRLADIYQQQDAYQEALASYLRLEQLDRKAGRTLQVALTKNNIGFVLKKLSRFQEAIPYFQDAIQVFAQDPKHSSDAVSAYINIGSVYNQLREYAIALGYLELALKEPSVRADPSIQAELYNFIAVTHLNEGAYGKGVKVVDGAIVLARQSHARDVLVRCYRTRALLCDNLLNYAEGSRYHQLYAEMKDSIRYEERLKEQSALLRDLNVERLEKELRLLITDTEKNQLVLRQSALEAEREIRQKEMMLLQREKDVQDYTYQAQALELEKIKIRKRELEAQSATRLNELERKEAEIRLNAYRKRVDERAHEARIRLLAQDKLLLEQTRKTQQQRIKGQKDRETMMFGIVLLAILAVTATYVGLSKAKTANLKLRVQQDEVVQQKESVERMFQLLETKNRSITDSIKYARRIQSVIVPGPETLSQALPLSFLLLRPRDVVSGDVFYLHRSERYTFLASIDCTGHGVPGAMLSVIGYQTLHSIVNAGTIHMPHAILHALDNALAQVLRIDQSDLQQGMDMGLIVIDRQERRLHFSGAVHNLVYFRNGILHEVKASRCSIGGLVPRSEKVYETTTLAITDHMQCYLASDGLPTQLGGPEGKKFGSNRLKKLYEEVAPLSAAAKKAAIEKATDEWIGSEHKQLDDILVIGFRADLAV